MKKHLRPISQRLGLSRRNITAGFATFCFCLAALELGAQSRKCSQATIDLLESESDGIRTWPKLREFYHRYRTCRIDDAEVTEGVSESVARLLADHWDTLPLAANLFKQDAAFETFALAGINITDLTKDLDHIDTLAAEHCPVGLSVLCHKVRTSIRANM